MAEQGHILAGGRTQGRKTCYIPVALLAARQLGVASCVVTTTVRGHGWHLTPYCPALGACMVCDSEGRCLLLCGWCRVRRGSLLTKVRDMLAKLPKPHRPPLFSIDAAPGSKPVGRRQLVDCLHAGGCIFLSDTAT